MDYEVLRAVVYAKFKNMTALARHIGQTPKRTRMIIVGEQPLSAKDVEMLGQALELEGEGFLRLSYANSLENLKIAVDRIDKFCLRLKRQ